MIVEYRSIGVRKDTAEAFSEVCAENGYKRWFILDKLINEWIEKMKEKEKE